MKNTFDFVILGAGVAGLSAAYFLSKSARVAVVERESAWGYHASGRSAAVFIEAYDNPTVSDLSLDSKAFFTEPPAGFSEYPLVKPIGGLMVIRPGESSAADAYLDTWSERCPALRKISADEAIERVPLLRSDSVAGAIYDPNLLTIDTNQLLQCYARGIRQNGGEIIYDGASSIQRKSTKHWAIEGSRLHIHTPMLLNAGGAWANQIASMASVAPLPITPCRRTALIVGLSQAGFDNKAPDWPMVRTLSQNLYFKPEDPGLLISPQDEIPSEPCDAIPEELDIAIAMDQFEQMCHLPNAQILSHWAGLRSLTPDRCPMIGFAADDEHFFWVAGQGGAGFQTSPAIGELIASALLQGNSIDAQIGPERFAS